MKLNLAMIVKNEERTLEKVLKAAEPLVDEIVIVDTGSTDRTKDISLQLGARLYEYPWKGDFSAARNFALDCSDADWNLVLDADETLLPCDRKMIEQQINACQKKYPNGFMGGLLLHNQFWNEGEVETSFSWLPRLLPGRVRYVGVIHEQPQGAGPIVQFPLEAEHDGYLQKGKGERNLPILQMAVREHPEEPYYQYQLGATLKNLKRTRESIPYFRDFYRLAERQSGYFTEGVLAYLYALIEEGGKAFLQEALGVIEAERASLGRRADFCFVCGLFYMNLVLSDVKRNLSYLPRIEESFLECLAIGEHPEAGGVKGTGSFKAAYNLGLWYEVSGQTEKALFYYSLSAREGFQLAERRLETLKK